MHDTHSNEPSNEKKDAEKPVEATNAECCGVGGCGDACVCGDTCDCGDKDAGSCGGDCACDDATESTDSTATANEATDSDIDQNRVVAAVSYLFFLCLVPLFFAKDSKFAMFHAKQGIVVAIFWVLAIVVSSIPLLGWIVGFFLIPFMTIVSIIGFIQAIQGKWYRMPFVADWSDRMKF